MNERITTLLITNAFRTKLQEAILESNKMNDSIGKKSHASIKEIEKSKENLKISRHNRKRTTDTEFICTKNFLKKQIKTFNQGKKSLRTRYEKHKREKR